MSTKRKTKDPIPLHFKSYEEAAEFWDTHSTADYEEFFKPVKLTLAKSIKKTYLLEVDKEVIDALYSLAQKKRKSVEKVANQILREKLKTAS